MNAPAPTVPRVSPRTLKSFLRDVDRKAPKRWAHATIQAALDAGLVRRGEPFAYPYVLTRDGLIEAGIYEG